MYLDADLQESRPNIESFKVHYSSDKNEMPSCDDCGIVFNDVHDIQRHVKTWCPESHDRQVKRLKIETPTTHEDTSIKEEVDNISWFNRMSENVQNNADFLTLLARSKPTLRKALLEKCNDDQANCLCELIVNLLDGKLPMSEETISKLKKNKKVLRELRNKNISLTEKKRKFNKVAVPLVNEIVKPSLNHFNITWPKSLFYSANPYTKK